MHQHPILTNKVSMEILDFKVINKYWFSKLFKLSISNFNLVTINSAENITNFKITGSYPALVLNIERVVSCSVDSFTVESRNVENFICFLDPDVENFFKLCFVRFGIVCTSIADINILSQKPIGI